MTNRYLHMFCVVVVTVFIGCTKTGTSGSTDGTTDDTTASCHLIDNTTETGSANSLGCYRLTRDVSSCQASRTAQGLSGFWLNFSCRVTLTKSGSNVVITTDSRPDTKSHYFASTSQCYEAFSAAGRFKNPNTLSAQSIVMTVPYTATPASSPSSVNGATIGIAVNGVSIFGNFAAPGDNIYEEADSFDKCEGHPQNSGVYHYHSEPTSITQTGSNPAASAFVGVMRDGYPVYGRLDADGSTPTLDASGGHTGTTVDSPSTPVYHYHVNYQTDGTDSAYFISKGKWYGNIGTCSGCN